MSEYKTHTGSLYDYSAGVYCGVVVKERVMKKQKRWLMQDLKKSI